MTNDNTRDPMKRLVFEYPVKVVLECRLFVLAYDHDDAYTEVTKVDLQDLIDYNEVSFHGHEGRLVIDDVHTTDPEDTLDADDGRQVSTHEYSPNEHPDWLGVPTK